MPNDEAGVFFNFMAKPEFYDSQYRNGYENYMEHFVRLGLASKTVTKQDIKGWLRQKKSELKAARSNLRAIALIGFEEDLSKLFCKIRTLSAALQHPEIHGPRPIITYRPTEKAQQLMGDSTVVISFDPKRRK